MVGKVRAMGDKLLARGDIAFDVDRGRMIRTLQKSRLSDKFAYIRDLLTPAAETKAGNLSVRGSLRRIVIQDDGRGIPFNSLDERLANIFTDDQTDELAAGILSAFHAGAREVRIETVPKADEAESDKTVESDKDNENTNAGREVVGGSAVSGSAVDKSAERHEPYQLSIVNEDGDIYISNPQPLEGKLRLRRGTRITIEKEGVFSSISANYLRDFLTGRLVPEVARVKQAAPYSRMNISVNGRKIRKITQSEETICQVPVDLHGVTGTLGLRARHGFKHLIDTKRDINGTGTCIRTSSTLHLFRKGFFHGNYIYPSYSIPDARGPFYAELNYDRLRVDISGKALADDKQNLEHIDGVINQFLPELYRKLLDSSPKKAEGQEIRRLHLLYHLAAYLGQTLYTAVHDAGSDSSFILNQRLVVGHPKNDPMQNLRLASRQVTEYFQRLYREPLFRTREVSYLDGPLVSLETIINCHKRNNRVFLDYRGYDYRNAGSGDLIIKATDPNDLGALVLAQLRFTHKMGTSSKMAGKWVYHTFHSETAERRRDIMQKVEGFLKVPLLYRPVQATIYTADFFYTDLIKYSLEQNKDKSWPLKAFSLASNLLLGCFALPVLYPIGLSISGIIGTAETINKGAELAAKHVPKYLPSRAAWSQLFQGFRERDSFKGLLPPAESELERRIQQTLHDSADGTYALQHFRPSGNFLLDLRQLAGITGHYLARTGKTALVTTRNLAEMGVAGTIRGLAYAGLGLYHGGRFTAKGIGYAAKGIGRGIVIGVGTPVVGAYYLSRYTGGKVAAAARYCAPKVGKAAMVTGFAAGYAVSRPFVWGYRGSRYALGKAAEKFSPRLHAYLERRRLRREELRLLQEAIREGQAASEEKERLLAKKLQEDNHKLSRKALARQEFEILLKSIQNEPGLKNILGGDTLQLMTRKRAEMHELSPRITQGFYSYNPIYKSYNGGRGVIIITENDVDVRKIIRLAHEVPERPEHFRERVREYLATLIIGEAWLREIPPQGGGDIAEGLLGQSGQNAIGTQETIMRYHSTVLGRRRQQFYSRLENYYSQGDAGGFLAGYGRMDREGRREVLSKVFGLSRQPGIDARLADDAISRELLEEIGRERIRSADAERLYRPKKEAAGANEAGGNGARGTSGQDHAGHNGEGIAGNNNGVAGSGDKEIAGNNKEIADYILQK